VMPIEQRGVTPRVAATGERALSGQSMAGTSEVGFLANDVVGEGEDSAKIRRANRVSPRPA
jgi:hypothetical protein